MQQQDLDETTASGSPNLPERFQGRVELVHLQHEHPEVLNLREGGHTTCKNKKKAKKKKTRSCPSGCCAAFIAYLLLGEILDGCVLVLPQPVHLGLELPHGRRHPAAVAAAGRALLPAGASVRRLGRVPAAGVVATPVPGRAGLVRALHDVSNLPHVLHLRQRDAKKRTS